MLGAITWTEKNLTFYLDGKKDSTVPLTQKPPMARGSKVVVGVSKPGGAEFYKGLLGLVLIYNRTLPEREVLQFFMQTRGRFR